MPKERLSCRFGLLASSVVEPVGLEQNRVLEAYHQTLASNGRTYRRPFILC